MKTNKLLIGLFLLGSLLSTQSCLNKQDDTDYGILYPNAVVTLKPDADGLILQLDDETALFPVNLQNSSTPRNCAPLSTSRMRSRKRRSAGPSETSM